ncbi:SOS response-associated peptidase family protein [Marinobacter salicampi]|uniref:SOS response-associated peptidase family protein n=1 Tax=Marinobacter salicampi TaxID=435907 RepID=UPI00140DA057|nr:SOS response-associated peptidase family protein [Marinobacter salicampi]
MCGYIRRVTDSPAVADLLDQIGLGRLASRFAGEGDIEHYYPAFGGNPERKIHHLIVPGPEGPTTVDATWWFDAQQEGGTLRLGRRTTFNARNLNSPYWKGALRHHRALVVATGLGESKWVNGKKTQYLMEGEQPFLLGALYRPFDNGCISCAVITRDSHPRFDEYHDKAFPCFVPADQKFVDQWLNSDGQVPDMVSRYLTQPQLTVPLRVAHVSTFKRGTVSLDSEMLSAD